MAPLTDNDMQTCEALLAVGGEQAVDDQENAVETPGTVD
jgi:hypothetical protein